MELTFIWNTMLGFLIALVWDILQRDRESKSSPKVFNLTFFWKDNKVRLIFTFFLSAFTMVLIFLNVKDAAYLFGKEWTELNNLIYIIIGAAPDLIISFAKRRVGFLQPEQVKGYVRVEDSEKKPKFDIQGNGGELPPIKPPTRPENP